MTYDAAWKRIAAEKQRFLEAMADGATRSDACRVIGRSEQTVAKWRRDDEEFKAAMDQWSGKRGAEVTGSRVVLESDREYPEVPDFASFRWDYFGFPTAYKDQEYIVEALEDFTNQVVIILGPPGSGKDTVAGQYGLWRSAPDRTGLRLAWIMESEPFSRRRLAERLAPYLTDPRVYDHKPSGPGTQKPTRSLIDDWGPFKWSKEYRWDNGEPVARTTWNKNEMYFMRVAAPESDPNLWATGITGTLYGARVDEMVMSDVFTRRNQKFRTTMEEQMGWFQGDAMSRLDEAGRLVVLGTRIKPKDNYERVLDAFVGESPVVYQNGSYTKHQNGVATVIFPAIQTDENGEEVSYWEDRFPLKSKLVLPDGRSFSVDELDREAYAALSAQPGAQRIRGLQEIRARMGEQFETVYQQSPPKNEAGEFSDAILARADDTSRTFEVVKPGELLVLGVDPARTFGAAWVLGGVDVQRETITVIDFWWGKKLGTSGIKNKLIIEPIVKYLPMWLAYEVNRESAILDDTQIQDVLKSTGTSLHRHHTSARNRGDSDAGVPVLSSLMRDGRLRFPAMHIDDRNKVVQLKTHFQAFDASPAGVRLNKKGSQWTGDPDDLAFACWVMVMKGLELIRAGTKRRSVPLMRGPVPRSIQRKRQRFQKSIDKYHAEKEKGFFYPEDMPDPNDLIGLFNYKGGTR